MGHLTLPDSGSIYLDTSGFIYSVEGVEPYYSLLEPMWRQAQDGQFVIVGSDITVLETLVIPLRQGNTFLEGKFRDTFNADEVEIIPITRPVWEEATRVRATTGLQTPDALHAAAAIHSGCTLFVTNDTDFRRVSDLPVAVLGDLLG